MHERLVGERVAKRGGATPTILGNTSTTLHMICTSDVLMPQAAHIDDVGPREDGTITTTRRQTAGHVRKTGVSIENIRYHIIFSTTRLYKSEHGAPTRPRCSNHTKNNNAS